MGTPPRMSSQRRWRCPTAIAVIAVLLAACGGSAPDPEVVDRGAALYASSCVQCHGGPDGGIISDIPPVHNANGHTWHHADCQLTEIILDGLPPRPGTAGTDEAMPGFGDELDEEDAAALLAYIETWWTDEQRASQDEVTADGCPDA